MKKSLRRTLIAVLTITMAACTSVEDPPGGGGSGGSAGTGGTGGTAGTGGMSGTGGTGGTNATPTVTLTATPISVANGTIALLSWDVTNATACDAQGDDWEGTRLADGGPEERFIYKNSRFELLCTGPGGTGSDEVDVSINTSQLLVSVDMDFYLVKAGDNFNVDVTVSNPGAQMVQNAFVTLVIPQYVIINPAALPSNATCTGACDAGEMIEWDIGAVDAGTVTVVSVEPEVALTVPDGEDIEFEVTTSADGEPDEVVSESTTEGESDLGLGLAQTPSEPQAGEGLVYTLSYDNSGPSPLSNVELTLTLPGPVAFVSANNGGTLSDGVVTWTFNEIAAGASGEVEARVDVNPTIPPGAQLRAAAGALVDGAPAGARATTLGSVSDESVGCTSSLDCDEGEICDDQTDTCIPHILTFVEVNPNPARTGEFVTVTVTVSNPGPNIETVDLEMALPQGMSRVSLANISDDGACDSSCDPGDNVRWTIDDLAPGKSELLWIRSTVAGGTLDDTEITFATAADTARGFSRSQSGSTVVQTARPLNLRVEESSNPATAGQALTYTVHYANRSADPLDPVIVTFTVPDNASHPSGDTVTVNLGRLASGQGGTEEITVTVDDPLAAGSQLGAVTEIAEMGSPETTSRAVTQTPVGQTPLLVTMEVNPDPVRAGEFVQTAVTVSNPGNAPETFDLVLTLPQAMGRVFGANISDGGACDGSCDPGDVIRWTAVDIAPGQSELFWIRSTVLTGGVGARPDGFLISYDAEVRASGEVPTSISGTTRIESGRSLNLRVEESSNPATAGQALTYTVHYANQSAGPLDPVILTLAVPDNASHPSGDTVTVNLGRLASGQGGTEEITVTVDDPLAAGSQLGAVTEIAEMGSPETTSRAVTQTPVSQTPFTLSVQVTPSAAARGTTLTVDVTIVNSGSGTETFDVVLTLPQAMGRVFGANISDGGVCDGSCDPGDVIRWSDVSLGTGASELLTIRSDSLTGGVGARPDGFLISYDVEVRATAEVPAWAGDTSRIETP